LGPFYGVSQVVDDKRHVVHAFAVSGQKIAQEAAAAGWGE
jgi:hypothetical protein